MKTVATYSMPAETLVPLSRLRDAGIDAVTRDEATLQLNWMWSNAIGGVKIDVPDDQLEDARAILHDITTAEGVLVCPHCASQHVTVAPLRPVSALTLLLAYFAWPTSRLRVTCLDCGKSHNAPRTG